MPTLTLFDLASRHSQWLTDRQSIIARNVANANTPGFKVQDVDDFKLAMDASNDALIRTQANHMASPNAPVMAGFHRASSGGSVLHSGNDVSLEQEFLKAGDVMRSFALDNQIVKAFNRMLLTSTKA